MHTYTVHGTYSYNSGLSRKFVTIRNSIAAVALLDNNITLECQVNFCFLVTLIFITWSHFKFNPVQQSRTSRHLLLTLLGYIHLPHHSIAASPSLWNQFPDLFCHPSGPHPDYSSDSTKLATIAHVTSLFSIDFLPTPAPALFHS